jgi:F420-0:gamma-glutamyl ligase-like protein
MKETTILVDNQKYQRLHIKTHVVMKDDDINDLVEKYASEHLKGADWLFISERVVAITQGRAYKISDIKVGGLARFLVKFVYKSPYGIGLAKPETMQLAIDEAGGVRIVLAAVIGGVFKIFGKRGVFYKIAGHNVNGIDGPCDYTLPPYNNYAVLAPSDPNKVAQRLSDKFKVKVVIIDANDLGVDVLGVSDGVDNKLAIKIFADNPLGQSDEQTPMAVVIEK